VLLQAVFSANDSTAMSAGDVRTAVFTMTATASSVALGTSTQTLTWVATPFSSNLPTNLLTITTPLGDWDAIQVDLVATLYDGTAQPMSSQQATGVYIASPAACAISSCPPVCYPPCSDKITQSTASAEQRVEDYFTCTNWPACDEKLAEVGVSPENRIGNYYYCIYGQPMPGAPMVRAEPRIDSTTPGQYPCSGTHQPVGTLTVGGSVSGGAVIKATVSASLSVSVAEQYDFACDYAMIAQAYGEGGFLRRVRMEKHETTTLDPLLMQLDPGAPGVPTGTFCEYSGLPGFGACYTPEDKVLRDAFSGAGIAGPGGGGTPAWPLPTQVTICPPTSPTLSLTAIGEPYSGLPLYEVTDSKAWACQNFAIHYL
jgi:hypothetical protein